MIGLMIMKIKNKSNLIVKLQDENLFRKRISTLRTYNMKAVKNYYFDELELEHVTDDKYKINLYTDSKFKLIYGQVYIKCTLNGNILTLIDIEPTRFLEKGFMCLLDTYKGVPIASESDLVKIKFFERIGKFK